MKGRLKRQRDENEENKPPTKRHISWDIDTQDNSACVRKSLEMATKDGDMSVINHLVSLYKIPVVEQLKAAIRYEKSFIFKEISMQNNITTENQLRTALEGGSLHIVGDILHDMGQDRILDMMLQNKEMISSILRISNDLSELKRYDSEKFIGIISNFMDSDPQMIRSIFHATRVYLATHFNKSFTPQLFHDFISTYEIYNSTHSVPQEEDLGSAVNAASSSIVTENSDGSPSLVRESELNQHEESKMGESGHDTLPEDRSVTNQASTESSKRADSTNSNSDNDQLEENKRSNKPVPSEQDDKDDSLHNLLDHLLAWIYELPDWLQQKILSSNIIQQIIESVTREESLCKLDSFEKIFSILPGVLLENDVSPAYQTAEAIVQYDNDSSSIDTSLIYNDGSVASLILPTVDLLGSDLQFHQHYPEANYQQFML